MEHLPYGRRFDIHLRRHARVFFGLVAAIVLVLVLANWRTFHRGVGIGFITDMGAMLLYAAIFYCVIVAVLAIRKTVD